MWEVVAVGTGVLELRRPRAAPATLQATEGAYTYTGGSGILLTFDRPAKGKAAGFRLDGDRVTNIRFARLGE